MALKRRTKVNEAFSMASMTDVIFLLLIFFMVTSTVVIPTHQGYLAASAKANSGETSYEGNDRRELELLRGIWKAKRGTGLI